MKRLFTPPRILAAAFFLLFLFVGLAVVDNYGVSWDEITQLEIGKANYRYLFKGDQALLTMRDRYYGPLFEIFLVRVMDQSSPRAMYLSRHVWTFLAFYVGVAAFYVLGCLSFKNGWLALLGSLMLALSPRIFADSFYNSKDIPFLSAAIFAALTLLWYLKKPAWRRLLLHALFTAVLIAIRTAGLYMLALTAGMLLIDVLSARRRVWRVIGDGAGYAAAVGLLCLLFYPVFWHDPLGGVITALQELTKFPQYTPVLFMGRFISPQELPWFYLPVWIGVTTPPAYLVLFVFGSGTALWALLRSPGNLFALETRPHLLSLTWFFGPLLAVILLRPAIYDGWRQMYFIYPGMVLLTVNGIAWLFAQFSHLSVRVRLGTALAGAAILFGPVLFQINALHPYQNVYFNRLAGQDMREVKRRFDLDYWGLSYRAGLEYILSVDDRDSIPVFGETPVAVRSAAIIGSDAERRLHFVYDPAEADYILGNYRWHPEDYSNKNEIYAVWAGDAKILSVFRINMK